MENHFALLNLQIAMLILCLRSERDSEIDKQTQNQNMQKPKTESAQRNKMRDD